MQPNYVTFPWIELPITSSFLPSRKFGLTSNPIFGLILLSIIVSGRLAQVKDFPDSYIDRINNFAIKSGNPAGLSAGQGEV